MFGIWDVNILIIWRYSEKEVNTSKIACLCPAKNKQASLDDFHGEVINSLSTNKLNDTIIVCIR